MSNIYRQGGIFARKNNWNRLFWSLSAPYILGEADQSHVSKSTQIQQSYMNLTTL